MGVLPSTQTLTPGPRESPGSGVFLSIVVPRDLVEPLNPVLLRHWGFLVIFSRIFGGKVSGDFAFQRRATRQNDLPSGLSADESRINWLRAMTGKELGRHSPLLVRFGFQKAQSAHPQHWVMLEL